MKPGGFIDREKEIVQEPKPVSVQSPKSVAMVSAEEVDTIVADRVEKALATRKKEKKGKDEEDEEPSSGINNKLVRELRDVASVFTALKEFSSNPLQTMIEQKVGSMAAGVIERSFSAPAEKPNQDIIDRILNSQMGAGLGAGLGQRGPELVDKLFGLFGKEKTEDWINGAMGGRGGSGGGSGKVPGPGGSGGQGSSGGGQSEVDLILQLDPTNPEHITAYAVSQGNIPLDVARKMLLVHQDAFIKKMEHDGQLDKANEIMLRRNNQLLNQKHGQENVQEYRAPAGMSFSGESQNLDVEEQKVDDDLKKNQIEPDAFVTSDASINPQLEPEVVEMGQVQVQEQVQEQQQPDIDIGVYMKSLTEMVGKLYDKVDNQNEAISRLQNDIDTVKTKKTNDEIDKEIFGGVRKAKGIKIGKEE